MTDSEFLELKQKIEKKKAESQKAEGVIEQIKSSWQKEYGISTVEEAEQKLADINSQTDEKKRKLESLKDKLDKMIPEEWK